MIRFAVVSILGFSSIEKHDAVQGFCFSDSKGGGYFHRQSSQVTKLGAVGAPTCENDENKGSAQHQPPKKRADERFELVNAETLEANSGVCQHKPYWKVEDNKSTICKMS
uniref:Uncharacterized protein n=1 Tax=Grammatophora oceanica TaxID=210454 RepID=A0A7S1Y6L3_9STRA|mmetsp:Transcript_33944/g.50354  ORF Transcript_33944/g.50354 Transcript_33944/m.50354 type:complete len:110 (+) Transcript_33944:1533-1862(+)